MLRLPRRRPPRRMRVSRRSPRQVRTAGLTVHDVIAQVLELGMPGLPGWDAAELAVGEAVNEWRYSTQSIQYVLLPLLQPIPTFRRLSSSLRPALYEKRSSIAILDCALFVLQGEVACCAARLCG